MDAYPLSIKATIDESQLRNHAQAESKAADKCVTDGRHTQALRLYLLFHWRHSSERSDEEIKASFMAATGRKTCAYVSVHPCHQPHHILE
jgi:hypothetical protein